MNNPTEQLNQQQASCRIWELDFVRGLCVLLMIGDHALYDLGFVFFQQWFPDGGTGILYELCRFAHDVYWTHPLRIGIRVLVVACFIFICGICCSFSRSNYKRGLQLLAVALMLTLVTATMDAVFGYTDFYIIRCGVLHMLSASILVCALLQRFGRAAWLTAGLLLLVVSLVVQLWPPDCFGLLPFILGIGGGSYSADYFPLLPWMGYFLVGSAAGGLLYAKKCSLLPNLGNKNPGRSVQFIGRYAIWFYLLHQPLVYGLLMLVGLLV